MKANKIGEKNQKKKKACYYRDFYSFLNDLSVFFAREEFIGRTDGGMEFQGGDFYL